MPKAVRCDSASEGGDGMTELPYVCLYASYLEALAPFTDEERGRIVTGMLLYATKGEVPALEGNERFIWPTIQSQIDRDRESYRKRVETSRANGAKGGRPKTQSVSEKTQKTHGFFSKPKKPKEKENEREKESENENANENERENEEPHSINQSSGNIIQFEKAVENPVENLPDANTDSQRSFIGGKLGQGVVLLSEDQVADLLSRLSLDEYEKYVAIVRDMELSGRSYKRKTHYQAILDMAAKDRAVAR